MASLAPLHSLFDQQRLWRGRPAGAAIATTAAAPTGHAALDAALPAGGWPPAALSELLLSADGIGELRLLLPTLTRLSRQPRPVVLVGPPYLPYAPALAAAGLDLARLHWIDPGTPSACAWALEQCLRSQACGAVLGWLPRADDRCLRRLQVAAESGQCLGFLFRPASAAANPSPAALRLLLQPGRLQVLKCRGGNPPAQPFVLPAGSLHDPGGAANAGLLEPATSPRPAAPSRHRRAAPR